MDGERQPRDGAGEFVSGALKEHIEVLVQGDHHHPDPRRLGRMRFSE
jgi:hypothetical protein